MKKKILQAEIESELKTLRHKSEEVKEVDGGVKKLVKDMFDSMKEANGIGLSAVQIGELKRVLIAEYAGSGTQVPRTVLINPEINWASKKEVLDEEGCLSIPNVYGMVKRPDKIAYRALDENGEVVEARVGGLLARVIQHELDHLDGVLFVDRVEGDLYTYEKQDDTKEI